MFQVCSTKFREVLHRVARSFLKCIVLREMHRGVTLVFSLKFQVFWHADKTDLLKQNADCDGFFGTQIGENRLIFKIFYELYNVIQILLKLIWLVWFDFSYIET